MSDPDYERWVALREYLRNATFEMRGDAQVSEWVKAWTRQIDDRLTISGQSYRVCQTCDRGGHACPGCGADVRHGEIACDRCDGRAPRTGKKALDECRCSPIKQEYCHAEGCKGGSMLGEFGIAQERETPVNQLVTGDSVYSPSTDTWHEVRRATSGQLYFERDGAWRPVDFAADVKFLTRRGDAGRAAGLLFDALGGEVIEDA
jgi:hypothetical protein